MHMCNGYVEDREAEEMYVVLRESVGSSMLHNLCRYILYVCRYIAKYIDGKRK